jgi:hypothetical protein
MTRYVVLFGVLVAVSLTLMWLVFTVLPSLPNTGIAPFDSILQTLRLLAAFNRYNDSTPFTRTGPLFQLWLVLLLISIAGDKFIKPAAKAAVSSFAEVLLPEVGQLACKVTQDSSWRAERRTMTSGTFQGRQTTVLVLQQTRSSYLTVEMGCRAPWVLDIRKRNLASEALAFVGAPVKTGHEALDEAVVVQGDDEVAIRQWARAAQVQPKLLSLFQVYGITSLTTETGSDEEPILRAYYARFRPRLFPLAHSVGILNDIAGLAASAETPGIHNSV